MGNKFLALLLCASTLSGLEIRNWSDIPPAGIFVDTYGNFSYDSTQPIILSSSLFFLNLVTLRVDFNIRGNKWTQNQCGLVFCAGEDNSANQAITFNTGNIVFNITSSAQTAQGTSLALFDLKTGSSLESTANIALNIAPNSTFSSVFNLNSAALRIEDANLIINLPQPNQTILDAKGESQIAINTGGNQNNQTIQLAGNLSLGNTSSLELHLGNANSYFRGNITTEGTASAILTLNNSNAWINLFTQNSTATSTLTLNTSNLYGTLTGNQGANPTNLNLTLNNSQWKMINTSVMGDLTLNHGKVDFLFGVNGRRLGTTHKTKTLVANSVGGSGSFFLYADVQARAIDTLSFTSATGSHSVFIFYNPNTFTQELAENIGNGEKIAVITSAEPDSQATFVGKEIDLGITSYTTNLEKISAENRTQWIISSIIPNPDSTTAKLLTTALNSPYRINTLLTQTLNQRLGDLRNYPKDYGLYFRYFVGQNTLNASRNTLQSKDLYMNFSFGFDSNAFTKTSTDFWGLGFDVLLLNSKISFYTNETIAYSPVLYWTSFFHNRFYYDIVLRYSYTNGKLDIQSSNIQTKTSLSSHAATLGAEVGYKLKLGYQPSFFFIQPQTKLNIGFIYVSELNLQDIYNQNIKAKTELQFPLLNKTSLLLGYEYNLEKLQGDVKLGPFLTYSLQSGANTLLSDPRTRLKKTFGSDFDVGLNISSNLFLQDYLRFYLTFDSSFLGQYKQDFLFNAGIRWNFGTRYIQPLPPPASPKRFFIRYKHDSKRRTIQEVRNNDIQNMGKYDTRGSTLHTYSYPKSLQSPQNRNINGLNNASQTDNPRRR